MFDTVWPSLSPAFRDELTLQCVKQLRTSPDECDAFARVVADIIKARAQTVPLRFMGQNSRLFQIVSHVHPALRLALFFHEMRRRIGAPIEARIGAPIPPQALEGLEAQAATALMRAACDALAREENAGDQPRPR